MLMIAMKNQISRTMMTTPLVARWWLTTIAVAPRPRPIEPRPRNTPLTPLLRPAGACDGGGADGAWRSARTGAGCSPP
jgi:hypothetical protein